VDEIAIHALAIDEGVDPLDPDLRDRHVPRSAGGSGFGGLTAGTRDGQRMSRARVA
jgi:hypothetical protein